MQTIIHTIEGTYIVPDENEAALLSWLQQHAVKAGYGQSVKEQVNSSDYSGRHLLSEDFGKEF